MLIGGAKFAVAGLVALVRYCPSFPGPIMRMCDVRFGCSIVTVKCVTTTQLNVCTLYHLGKLYFTYATMYNNYLAS